MQISIARWLAQARNVDYVISADPLDSIRIPNSWIPSYATLAGLARSARTLAFLEANPTRHLQSSWITEHLGAFNPGVRACFAGWTVLLAGAEPLRSSAPLGGHVQLEEVTYGGTRYTVPELARELLEVNCGFASEMFYGRNTLEDLWKLHRLAELSACPDFVPEHWSVRGDRIPTADTMRQLARTPNATTSGVD